MRGNSQSIQISFLIMIMAMPRKVVLLECEWRCLVAERELLPPPPPPWRPLPLPLHGRWDPGRRRPYY
jgi:hypothetical protein